MLSARFSLTACAMLAAMVFAQAPAYSAVPIASYSTYAHTDDPARCVANSGVTAFAGCLAWDRFVTSCNNYASASQASAYFNCYCQQDCNDEERRCLGSTIVDADFTDDYSNWHSYCDPIVNYAPTTPVLASITAPYNLDYCITAQDACTSMAFTRSSCYIAYQSNSALALYTSCVCAPPVLSQEFTCSFLANISCAQVPAHLNHMSGWTFCSDNIDQVLTVPPSLTASLGTETTTRWTYFTASSTNAPSLRSASYSSPTQTTVNENAANVLMHGCGILALLVGGLVAFLVSFA